MAPDIGGRLKDLRTRTGLSQAALARMAGRKKADTWRDWENGVRQPDPARLEDMAEREGWPLEIFQKDGPMPSEVVNRSVNEKNDTGATSHEGEEVDGAGKRVQLSGTGRSHSIGTAHLTVRRGLRGRLLDEVHHLEQLREDSLVEKETVVADACQRAAEFLKETYEGLAVGSTENPGSNPSPEALVAKRMVVDEKPRRKKKRGGK